MCWLSCHSSYSEIASVKSFYLLDCNLARLRTG
uniref:Uncharacterized protein n=1 Tax=Anguilla anguilla TaxID=7936 RepID=A0A0E9UEK3_ANGAN